MVGTTLSHELRSYIQSQYNQGILDHNFDRVQSFQNEETPRFVMEVLGMFSHDADDMIKQVTTFLYAC
ncbi:putative Histidine-containing phosphotransfer protein [Corchorus olitorius]|uniref:Histidine-containing phosphotransfer protein n=1 Tax=Corchorus olitorius TaxID=93759 RepID=A0A1R3J2L5_9ROSI|nr:putative Histidine-containing phosphotransfer protein [Corchorus olitorius]